MARGFLGYQTTHSPLHLLVAADLVLPELRQEIPDEPSVGTIV